MSGFKQAATSSNASLLAALTSVSLVLTSTLSGCVETISEKSTFDWLANHPQLNPGNNSSNQSGPNSRRNRNLADQPTAWAIRLAAYTGPNRYAKAQQLVDQLLSTPNNITQGSWIVDTGQASAVYIGRFDDPKSDEAQNKLKAIQAYQLKGQPIFQNAGLYALGGSNNSGIGNLSNQLAYGTDPWNLTSYPGMNTLLIGRFNKNFPGDRMKAAEAQVKQLRENGTTAFFYHGPNESLVCVGLFSDDQAYVLRELTNQQGAYIDDYSPAVLDLQAQHPYQSYNGMTPEQWVNQMQTQPPSSLLAKP